MHKTLEREDNVFCTFFFKNNFNFSKSDIFKIFKKSQEFDHTLKIKDVKIAWIFVLFFVLFPETYQNNVQRLLRQLLSKNAQTHKWNNFIGKAALL